MENRDGEREIDRYIEREGKEREREKGKRDREIVNHFSFKLCSHKIQMTLLVCLGKKYTSRVSYRRASQNNGYLV